MSDFVNIFQDGIWKEYPVVSRAGDYVTYFDLASKQQVTVLESSLPYKEEEQAQEVRRQKELEEAE